MFAEEGSDIYGVLRGTRTSFQYQQSAFTVTEAWNLDTKLDDGVAGVGRMIGLGSCLDGPNTQTTPPVQYILTCTDLMRLWFYVQ